METKRIRRKARADARCDICFGIIRKKEEYILETCRAAGQRKQYKVHAECMELIGGHTDD